MKSHRPDNRAHSQRANPLASAVSGSMAGIERNASVLSKSLMTFQEEGVRFATRRIEDNMRAFERLTSCRSLPDLLVAQQQWLADTARAYSEEWAKYGELLTDALQEETESLNEAVGEATPRTH